MPIVSRPWQMNLYFEGFGRILNYFTTILAKLI